MSCGFDPAAVITLRPECPEDESLLFELYAASRADELAATGWDQSTRTAFLQMQFRARGQSYRGMFPQATFSIILANGRVIGRLVVNRAKDEIRIVDIALLASYQGHGLGTRLLGDLCKEAASENKAVRLHTLKNSRAKRLYERLGFSRIGETGVYVEMEWRAKA